MELSGITAVFKLSIEFFFAKCKLMMNKNANRPRYIVNKIDHVLDGVEEQGKVSVQ